MAAIFQGKSFISIAATMRVGLIQVLGGIPIHLESLMRKLGFLLLFLGFGWICLLQFHFFMGAGVRPIALLQYKTLSNDPNQRYTRKDVESHIRDTALSFRDHLPFVLTPGCIMLVGGLLLAFSVRRHKAPDAA